MTLMFTFDLDLDMEQQGQGQRSIFRTLPSKIVKTLHVPTKCFRFLPCCATYDLTLRACRVPTAP